ncbi:MAG: hypothetical protein JWM05_2056 [Acidimicrobiales bacterium]|nr:hypothetical protein [Acidimicrobiales bacterium]
MTEPQATGTRKPGDGRWSGPAHSHRFTGRAAALVRTLGHRLGAVGFLATVLFAMPALAALGSALRRSWLPVSDWALIELHVREVGTGQTPLVGAYSRYGWHHPGPWPFYLLAVPYRIIGSAHGLLAGAALWNLAALVAIAVLLWTTNRWLAVLALPLLALLVHTLGAAFLSDPWNPSLPVLLIALLVPVAHRHSLGAGWTAPVFAALASIVVQAHVSLLPMVVAITAGAVVVRRLGRSTPPRPARRSRRGPARVTMATILVLLVAWTPVVMEQALHHPGNLTLITRYLRGSDRDLPAIDQPRLGVGGTARLMERQLALPGPWMGAREPVRYFDLDSIAGTGRPRDLLPLLVAFAAAVAVAVRRRDRDALTLLGLAVAGTAGMGASLVALRGPPYGWLVRGVWAVAAWVWIACAWALGRAALAALGRDVASPAVRRDGAPAKDDGRAGERGPRVPLPVVAYALVVLAALSATTAWRGSLGERRVDLKARATERMAPAAVAAARKAGGAFLFPLPIGGQETWGLVLALDRAGVPWTVDIDEAEHREFTLALSVNEGQQSIDTALVYGARLLSQSTLTTMFGQQQPVAVMSSRLDVNVMRARLQGQKVVRR